MPIFWFCCYNFLFEFDPIYSSHPILVTLTVILRPLNTELPSIAALPLSSNLWFFHDFRSLVGSSTQPPSLLILTAVSTHSCMQALMKTLGKVL